MNLVKLIFLLKYLLNSLIITEYLLITFSAEQRKNNNWQQSNKKRKKIAIPGNYIICNTWIWLLSYMGL